jgi:hypothetical protein
MLAFVLCGAENRWDFREQRDAQSTKWRLNWFQLFFLVTSRSELSCEASTAEEFSNGFTRTEEIASHALAGWPHPQTARIGVRLCISQGAAHFSNNFWPSMKKCSFASRRHSRCNLESRLVFEVNRRK